MKLMIKMVTALALCLALPLFAQEVSTATAPEETPAATALPAKGERKKESAAPVQKELSAAVPARPATETISAVPPKPKAVEAALKQLENQWQGAIAAHDLATVDALVAPDFAGINAEGKFVKKSDVLAQVKNDKSTYQLAKNDKLNVHLYGVNIAVVTGSVRSKGRSKNGDQFDRFYRYTDTWVERDGRWQCVASQDSLLTD